MHWAHDQHTLKDGWKHTHMHSEGAGVPDWGVECYSKLITGGHPALPFHN